MKEPMDLKDLPDYLKNIKENNSFGDDVVVNMGNIKEPTNNRKFIIFASGTSLILTIGLFIGYSLSYKNTDTIILSADNNSIQSISDIISSNGANIVSIKQKENNTFEIKFKKLKDLSSFLENLRKNKQLKNVELKN